jgi:membrane protease subunit HflC
MASRIIIGILFVVAVLWSCTFRVFEQERAVLFQLGEIKRADFTPGLHFLIPIYQNVRKFDGRLQTLDSEPQRFLTGEKKDVIVDSFVRWRIKDVVKFYLSTGGDPRRAGLLVYQKINDALRVEFGKRKVQEVVAGQRGAILDIVNAKAAERGQELGIEVVDVRVKRIDLPAEVSNAVHERMRAERARVARELRARGEKGAIRIRADTDRQATVIAAEAYRDGETLRGEGDAKASQIYAAAYARDAGFYEFYRSLGVYRDSFNDKSDVLVLAPDSALFKYFRDPSPR